VNDPCDDTISVAVLGRIQLMITQSDSATELARVFKSLSDPTRLRILEFLRGLCCEVAVSEKGDVHPVNGPTFGEVCCHVTGKEKITTTVSFHLNELRDAGLIDVEKRGRYMICAANRQTMRRLAAYLQENAEPGRDDCCSARNEI
jgi:ArsR family transcriptional regulator